MSPKFGFFKRKTSENSHLEKNQDNNIQKITDKELLEIIVKQEKILEKDLISDLEPARRSILDCLDRLRSDANDLEDQEIKVENPQFESLINNSKRIFIASIKKESFIESSEINNYEDVVRFKNNLELLINRFGQVGDSHNRILNEFMRKHINKFKSEFESLSSLLKEVTKTITGKELKINKSVACRDDLVLLKEKSDEMKYNQDILSELTKENESIDNNIKEIKRKYEDFKRSGAFLSTMATLEKIRDKKNEIAVFEKNIVNMVSNLSRPITKFSYQASKETQGRLEILQNEPLEIFRDLPQYIFLFDQLRKLIVEKNIQIKDPEKTINQIDEIVNSLPTFSTSLNNLNEELIQLESSVNSKNLSDLDDLKSKSELYEKYRSEIISKIQKTNESVNDIDSSINLLKTKIEANVSNLTNKKYSIL